MSIERERPWEAEGVSRAMWYRRRQKARLREDMQVLTGPTNSPTLQAYVEKVERTVSLWGVSIPYVVKLFPRDRYEE